MNFAGNLLSREAMCHMVPFLNVESDITNKNMPRAGTRIRIPEHLNIKKNNAYPRTIRCRSSFKKQKGQNLQEDKVNKRLGSPSTKSVRKNSDTLTHMFTSPNQFMTQS